MKVVYFEHGKTWGTLLEKQLRCPDLLVNGLTLVASQLAKRRCRFTDLAKYSAPSWKRKSIVAFPDALSSVVSLVVLTGEVWYGVTPRSES